MRFLIAFALVLGSSASFVSAQAAPAAPAASQPSVLSEFDPGYRNVVIIPDPLPHVQAMLNSPQLGRLWNNGKLIAALRKDNPRMTIPTPQALWFLILQNHRWVPSEIALGLHDSGLSDVDHLFRAILLMGLCDAAETVGDEEEAAATLRQQLLADLKDIHVPPVRVWVRFRDIADAQSLFELISEQATRYREAKPFGLSIVTDQSAVRARLSVAESFPQIEERMEMLENMGWITGKDDPQAGAMEDAFSKLRADVSIELRGNGLRLTFGRSPSDKPMTAADLGPLYKAGDERTILFASWEASKLIAAGEGWVKLLEQWEKTKIFEEYKKQDDEDFAGDLRLMARQFKNLGAAGAVNVWNAEESVKFEMQERGVQPSPPLAQSPLLKLIPADSTSYMTDTTSTLAERVSNSISDAEGRLATKQMQAEMKGGVQQQVVEKMASAYYGHFGDLRKFIHHESQDWFAPGAAFVFGASGNVRKFEVGSRQNPKDRFGGSNLPVPEFAMMGVTTQKQPEGEYVRRFYDGIVQGARASTGKADAKGSSSVIEKDLGLGTQSWVLDGSWMEDVAKDFTLTIEGDVQPHYFVHEGVLVFSTSPALSKRLLAAAREKKSMQLPATPAGKQGQLVAYGRFDGKLGVALFDHTASWMELMRDANPPPRNVRRPQQDPKVFGEIVRGMGEVLGLVNNMQWQSWQQTDTRMTSGDVLFVK